MMLLNKDNIPLIAINVAIQPTWIPYYENKIGNIFYKFKLTFERCRGEIVFIAIAHEILNGVMSF